jgi:prophage regulatory protein
MASKPQQPPSTISILRRPDVEARTGLSRSTIYLKVAQGAFPKPINLGPRAVGWVTSEIDCWLEQQIAASRHGA